MFYASQNMSYTCDLIERWRNTHVYILVNPPSRLCSVPDQWGIFHITTYLRHDAPAICVKNPQNTTDFGTFQLTC